MKKFFKYLVIILLVFASVGGTCYFFYRHLTRRQDSQAYISNYLYSSSRVEFNAQVEDLISATGDRFVSLNTTKSNLDEILSTFNSYLINAKNYDVEENSIIERMDNYLNLQNEVSGMITSYMNRLSSPSFNPVTGANEILLQFSNMNVAFADALMYIDGELDKMEIVKNADVKFSMIDLYLNVVVTTFDNTEINSSGVREISNTDSINLINNHFRLENSMLVVPSDTTYFTSYNNNFILHYANVDKANYAENLAFNLNQVSDYNDNLSEVQKTSYYFKMIYRI
ncbi:MAG TPA: hypothetical protein IAB72_00970 [Candidatus Onthoplasma faecipullorum]|nr:hypothetical protein [Candidatus Onthoplasma faecipullorum]